MIILWTVLFRLISNPLMPRQQKRVSMMKVLMRLFRALRLGPIQPNFVMLIIINGLRVLNIKRKEQAMANIIMIYRQNLLPEWVVQMMLERLLKMFNRLKETFCLGCRKRRDLRKEIMKESQCLNCPIFYQLDFLYCFLREEFRLELHCHRTMLSLMERLLKPRRQPHTLITNFQK